MLTFQTHEPPLLCIPDPQPHLKGQMDTDFDLLLGFKQHRDPGRQTCSPSSQIYLPNRFLSACFLICQRKSQSFSNILRNFLE